MLTFALPSNLDPKRDTSLDSGWKGRPKGPITWSSTDAVQFHNKPSILPTGLFVYLNHFMWNFKNNGKFGYFLFDRNCGSHGTCAGQSSILYAWAKNADGTQLPPSVGFRIGNNDQSRVKYLVIQVHYATKLPPGVRDYTGLDLEITSQPSVIYSTDYFLVFEWIFWIDWITGKSISPELCWWFPYRKSLRKRPVSYWFQFNWLGFITLFH